MLSAYYTGIGISQKSRWLNILPRKLHQQYSRRAYDLPSEIINSRPIPEILRHLSDKFYPGYKSGRNIRANIDRIYYDLDAHVAKVLGEETHPMEIKAVYGYEDGCRDSFSQAKLKNFLTFYELPIGYWRAGHEILFEEAELQPQWSMTIPALNEPERKLMRKDEELANADHIFVASSFTRETLKKAPKYHAEVEVISYGAPIPMSQAIRAGTEDKPLRALFVGGLSQRKGISYLFEAVDSLNGMVELTVIGRRPEGCPILNRHLNRHEWIASLSHVDILEAMSRHDVLIFPSLFEGFGLVILEALSRGLPVITTPHTAGPDVLTDGKDGFIVPIRSSNAIMEKLELLYRDRDMLNGMKNNALESSRQYTWQRYGEQLVSSIKSFIVDK